MDEVTAAAKVLTFPWRLIPASGAVTGIPQLKDGTIVGCRRGGPCALSGWLRVCRDGRGR